MQNIGYLIAAIVLVACSGHEDPMLHYKSKFDPAFIPKVETIVRQIASESFLEIHENDREGEKILTFGEEAFFIVLMEKKKTVFAITNSGVGDILSIMTFRTGNSLRDKEMLKLSSATIKKIEEELAIDFCDIIKESPNCDEVFNQKSIDTE